MGKEGGRERGRGRGCVVVIVVVVVGLFSCILVTKIGV